MRQIDLREYFYISTNMEINDLTRALAALAHPERLAVFRLLAPKGQIGMAAGDISLALNTPANSLSTRLNQLVDAGLIGRRRDGRSLIYAINAAGVRAVILALTNDCCQGRVDLCGVVPARDGAHVC